MINYSNHPLKPVYQFIAIIIFFALIPLAGCSSQLELHGSTYDQTNLAPDLDLQNTKGEPFSLQALRGDVVLIYFGYTHCPDICPATLAELKWVNEQVGSQSERLDVVFISIDPDRDDPTSIRKYLDRFNGSFIGLTGTDAQLETATADYAVVAQRDAGNDENYTMTHTSRVFLIDQQGQLRTNYTFDEPREGILSDVQYLLEN